jgi:nicotinamidase-related amidase
MASSDSNGAAGLCHNGKPLGKLCSKQTALLVCDVQERNRPLITGFPAVIDATRRLVRGANILGVPVLASEASYAEQQHVVNEIKEHLHLGETPIVVKTAFSMVVPETLEFLKKHSGVRQVLLCGVETHACILQTALDLLEEGYEVHLAIDGVSSQRPYDRAVGLHRLSQSGVLLCTSEMALYQLANDCNHPKFGDISALCLEPRPDYLGVPGVMGATSL